MMRPGHHGFAGISASAWRRRQISHRLMGATMKPCAKVSERIQIATIEATVSAYTTRMPATATKAASTGARRHVVHEGGRSIVRSTSRFMGYACWRHVAGRDTDASRAATGGSPPAASWVPAGLRATDSRGVG